MIDTMRDGILNHINVEYVNQLSQRVQNEIEWCGMWDMEFFVVFCKLFCGGFCAEFFDVSYTEFYMAFRVEFRGRFRGRFYWGFCVEFCPIQRTITQRIKDELE